MFALHSHDRCIATAVALAATLATTNILFTTEARADSSTIRIETRAFYGATVTLEEGVRVYRPLPAHGRVIINPGGRTPLNLTLEERRIENNTHAAAQASANATATTGPAAVGGLPVRVLGGKPGRPHGHKPTGGHGGGGSNPGKH